MNNLEWSEAHPPLTWNGAVRFAENSVDGWRLPTVQELIDCWDYEVGKPKFEEFLDKIYWSSNASVNNASLAWCVCFYSGHVDNYMKGCNYHVRLVRESNLSESD